MGKTIRRVVRGAGKRTKIQTRKSKRNVQHQELAMLKRR